MKFDNDMNIACPYVAAWRLSVSIPLHLHVDILVHPNVKAQVDAPLEMDKRELQGPITLLNIDTWVCLDLVVLSLIA